MKGVQNVQQSSISHLSGGDALTQAIKYTEEKLKGIVKDRKFAMRVLLAAEEAAALFIEKAKPGAF